MLEARLAQAALMKKLVEAMKELVSDASFDCSAKGLKMQAMDASHVSLCFLELKSKGFDHFRCDKACNIGLNLQNLSKILKCAANEDTLTMKKQEESDNVTFMFENNQQDKIMDFEMKTMEIDAENLGIPDTEYKCKVTMDSGEFMKIIRDLQVLGDSCTIKCDKEGIRFSVSGDVGKANIVLKQSEAIDVKVEDVKDVKGKKTVSSKQACKIEMDEPVELSFALRYLSHFTKATPLSSKVSLSMSEGVPLVVEYSMEETGKVKYFLAPKIDEEEGN